MTTQNQVNKSDLPLAGGTMTGAINMGGFGITSLLDPVNPQDAVTKNYADNIISGGAAACVAASTTALTVTYSNGVAGVGATLTNAGAQATFALDGQSPTVGQRVLIKDQSSTLQNGIYTVTSVGSGATNWILTRATDYNTPDAINDIGVVPVTAGTVNQNTGWINTTIMVAVGTTAITFIKFSSLIALPVSLANGGTNASLTASNGGIVWSNATQLQILSGTATANQILMSGASTTPAWSTATYPATAGTSGNVLTSDGTNWSSSPSATAGGWQKITRTVASSAASVVFSSLTTTYQAYAIVLTNVIPANNTVDLALTYNAISTGYNYASAGIDSSGSALSGHAVNAASILLNNAANASAHLSNSANAGYSGIIFMYGPDTANAQFVTWDSTYFNSSGGVICTSKGGGMNTGTTAVTSITFAMSAGNIASGVFELYGLVA